MTALHRAYLAAEVAYSGRCEALVEGLAWTVEGTAAATRIVKEAKRIAERWRAIKAERDAARNAYLDECRAVAP